ncbi:radical SAM family heme chaperone HemW [Pleurocapsa sp. FMAR1]|uniref:radical SAM family heme chaperone HemW n=1 Tax=Pleurocapsa sp. FMAR1 TaxID=3040204 RepID=UPI0029C605CA|nr:radical SAM family heme chaperone HemW [Pleurocapsa sp. FMAR1]
MAKNISLTRLSLNSNLVATVLDLVPTAAYIHIPFCRRRCFYCDFPISVVGNSGGKSASIMLEEYIAALIKDIQSTPSTEEPLQTVFFGGGTPSLLSPQQLTQIIQAIASHFGIADNAEISMEIDPGTFDRHRLLGYLEAGLNRFSLGVQTFDEELLKVCGRSHTLADAMQAVEIIKQLEIDNFSLDLISGLPHQTLEHCLKSLETAIAIAPKHLSCYDLVLEPVTAFGKQYQPGETPLPNDDDAAQMYRLTQATLTKAGYQHYEISNYAQPGYQCRHNRVYWENKPYYGFGMGAASYVAGKRFSRPRTRREYYAWLETGSIVDAPEISATDYILETLMLGLRLAEGIDLEQFEPDILKKIWSCIKPYYRQGWIEILDNQEQLIDLKDRNSLFPLPGRVRLSDPEGFLFSNTVLASLFEKLA